MSKEEFLEEIKLLMLRNTDKWNIVSFGKLLDPSSRDIRIIYNIEE